MYGIYLSQSISINASYNTMLEDGIFIYGNMLEYWNTHTINTSNNVNGKPVYYRKDQNGGTIPPGAGEVILANCTYVEVENEELTCGTVGIELGYSSNNNITANNCSSNILYGLYIYSSFSNNISGNTITSNDGNGIQLVYSSNNNISGCNISSNDYYGISMTSSASNDIYNNTITWNDRAGIYCKSNSNPTIKSNDIENNTWYGVWSGGGSDPVINYNNIKSNKYGVWSGDGSEPTIHNNTITGHYDPSTGTGYGVYNADSSITIDARWNWWGHTTGPYDPDDNRAQGGDYNPNGQGDRVRDVGSYIIMYRPWTT